MKRIGSRVIMAGLAVAVVVGCAQKETVVSQRQSNWEKANPEGLASARPEDPPHILPKTHYVAGKMFESQGALSKAIVQYKKTLELDPEHIGAMSRLGMLYARLGRFDESEHALKQAVRLAPQSVQARNNLGFGYLMQKRWSDAEAEFRNALAMMPEFDRARINLGIALCRQQRFHEALAEFREVVPDADAFYNLALMFRAEKRYQDAGRALKRAIRLNPRLLAAKQQLAQVGPRLRRRSRGEQVMTDGQWQALVTAQPLPANDVEQSLYGFAGSPQPQPQPQPQPEWQQPQVESPRDTNPPAGARTASMRAADARPMTAPPVNTETPPVNTETPPVTTETVPVRTQVRRSALPAESAPSPTQPSVVGDPAVDAPSVQVVHTTPASTQPSPDNARRVPEMQSMAPMSARPVSHAGPAATSARQSTVQTTVARPEPRMHKRVVQSPPQPAVQPPTQQDVSHKPQPKSQPRRMTAQATMHTDPKMDARTDAPAGNTSPQPQTNPANSHQGKMIAGQMQPVEQSPSVPAEVRIMDANTAREPAASAAAPTAPPGAMQEIASVTADRTPRQQQRPVVDASTQEPADQSKAPIATQSHAVNHPAPHPAPIARMGEMTAMSSPPAKARPASHVEPVAPAPVPQHRPSLGSADGEHGPISAEKFRARPGSHAKSPARPGKMTRMKPISGNTDAGTRAKHQPVRHVHQSTSLKTAAVRPIAAKPTRVKPAPTTPASDSAGEMTEMLPSDAKDDAPAKVESESDSDDSSGDTMQEMDPADD